MAVSHDLTYPLYPVMSFLGFFVCLVPLPWHIQAWNSGTCAFMIWTAIACLVGFVNSIVWAGNVEIVAPIWCDISSKLLLGASIGIPASNLCISRRLYSLTSVKTATITREDKLRMIIGDVCIAAGIPLLIMILHVIVQGHRFDILEDIGCYPVVYNTLPAYFLYIAWPTVIGVVSFCFSCLTLRSVWLRRTQFSQLLASNTSSLNLSRYLRLMMLAFMDMLVTVPQSIYIIYIGTKGVPLEPWISWADTHFNFQRMGQIPAIIWRSDSSYQTGVELTRWLPVACAFQFFALFGFALEAQKHYKLAFWAVLRLFGYKPSTQKGFKVSIPGWNRSSKSNNPAAASVGSLPVYVPRSPISPSQKKSYGDTLSTSYASTDVELSIYTDADLEKTAGLPSPSSSSTVAPPEYTRPEPHHVPFDVTATTSSDLGSPSLPTTPRFAALEFEPGQQVTAKTSNATLRSIGSGDRIYVSSQAPRTRTPSPPPFANVGAGAPPYHRPFASQEEYPAAQPHPGSHAPSEAVQVSRFTEAV